MQRRAASSVHRCAVARRRRPGRPGGSVVSLFQRPAGSFEFTSIQGGVSCERFAHARSGGIESPRSKRGCLITSVGSCSSSARFRGSWPRSYSSSRRFPWCWRRFFASGTKEGLDVVALHARVQSHRSNGESGTRKRSHKAVGRRNRLDSSSNPYIQSTGGTYIRPWAHGRFSWQSN